MENNLQELRAKINKMQEVHDSASTPEQTKALIKAGLDKARAQLAELEKADNEVKQAEQKQKDAEKEAAAAKEKATEKKKDADTHQEKVAIDKKVSPIVEKARAATQKTKQAKAKVIPAKKAVEKSLGRLSKLIGTKPTLKKLYAGTPESDLQRDAGRKAKSPGKRKAADGSVYYEHRANRVDVTHPRKGPFLEKGGKVKIPSVIKLDISQENTLSSQLQKLTGSIWNALDFKNIGPGAKENSLTTMLPFQHIETGKIFQVNPPKKEKGGAIDNYYQVEYYAKIGEHGSLGSYSDDFEKEYKSAIAFLNQEKKAKRLDELEYIGVSGSGDKFAIVYITKWYLNTIDSNYFDNENSYQSFKDAADKYLETGKPQKGQYSSVKEKGGNVEKLYSVSIDYQTRSGNPATKASVEKASSESDAITEAEKKVKKLKGYMKIVGGSAKCISKEKGGKSSETIQREIDWDQFEEEFEPIQNKISNREEYNGWLFETYGEDEKYIFEYAKKHPNNVWTIIDGDYQFITNGLHHVNRFGYVITKKAWANNELVDVVDPEDKDDYENEQNYPDNYADGGQTGEIIWLCVNGEAPVSWDEFYKENTAEDVEPLSAEEFDQIKNLKVGERWEAGGASGSDIMRVSGPDNWEEEIQPERELLIDESRGIYIPKHFYDSFDFAKFNLKKEDYADLSSPENEFYWDAWDELLEAAVTDEGDTLDQDGDLWLVKSTSNNFKAGGTTAADLKRKLQKGQAVKMVKWYGHTAETVPNERIKGLIGKTRYIVKVQTNGIYLSPDKDATTGSYLEFPPASLMEITDKGFKTFEPGVRELNEKEKSVIANAPKDAEQDRIDMLSDGSTMYYRRKSYYEKSGYGYLYNSGWEKGLHFNSNTQMVDDKSIKGKEALEYEFIDENFEGGGKIEKSGGELKYKTGDPVRFVIVPGEKGGYEIAHRNTKKAYPSHVLNYYIGSNNRFDTPQQAHKAIEDLATKLHKEIPAHNPPLSGKSLARKIMGFGLFELGGIIKANKTSQEFAKSFLKKRGSQIHDIIFIQGNVEHEEGTGKRKLTQQGYEKLRRIMDAYISTDLRQGANISHQALEKMTRDDFDKLLNNLFVVGARTNYSYLYEDGGNLLPDVHDGTQMDNVYAEKGGAIKTKNQFYTAAISYLKSDYGLDPGDMNMSADGHLDSDRAFKDGVTPQEFIDSFADKYELSKIPSKSPYGFAEGGKTQSQYVSGVFTLDDDKEYPGYEDPNEDWNGWACPLFEKEVALKILKDFNTPFEWRGEKLFADLSYDGQTPESSEFEEIGPDEFVVEGKKINLYSVGGYSWIWSAVENPKEKPGKSVEKKPVSVAVMKQRILDFVKKFPVNATDWGQATGELPDLHEAMADMYVEHGGKYKFDFEKRSSTPKELNTRHSGGIKKLLGLMDNDQITDVYNRYSDWFGPNKKESGGNVSDEVMEIAGVKHTKTSLNNYQKLKTDEYSHPLGTVYLKDGKGYVANGYDWYEFDEKYLPKLKKARYSGKYAHGGNIETGVKSFNVMQNIGHAKYVVNYHNGVKKHPDGSDFFDVEIFKNKEKLKKFTDGLLKEGYIEKK